MGKPEMYGMDLAFEIDGKVSDKETITSVYVRLGIISRKRGIEVSY